MLRPDPSLGGGVVVYVALATVPIKGTANVFCAVVDKQVNIADYEEPVPL